MKRYITVLFLLCVCICCGLFFSACEESSNRTSDGSGIIFKTLTKNDNGFYGKVSHDTSIFNFLQEIETIGDTKYTVSTDINGNNIIASKNIELKDGDNQFYISVTVEGDVINFYSVVIRRRPIYQVSFNTDGGSSVIAQYIEEDDFATDPGLIPDKIGCTFNGWDFDFSCPIKNQVIVSAKWDIEEDLKPFSFYSTSATCEITGVKDKDINTAVIPDIVTSIRNSSFYNCSSLTSITIPDSVMSIGRSVFNGCSSLTSVTIPDSITSIGDYAFYNCSSLTSITIPDSVTSIGYEAFSGCPIESAKIPAIACSCVKNSNLKNVEITSGEYIESNAFSGCSSLKSITISDSITSIGNNAFSNCPIETAKIPTFVIQFIPKSNLKTIEITSGESIGDDTFRNCSSLTSIIVSENNTNYKSMDGNLYSKDGKTLIQYAIGKTASSFTIHDGVTSIGRYAFYNCSSLTNITIADSVTSIGSSAFYNCIKLTRVNYAGTIDSWCEVTFADSILNDTRQLYINDELVTEANIIIATKINAYAFQFCSSLTSVTIGNSVTSIGNSAFNNCSSLTSITIPDGVTSIGGSAFYNCSSLTSITIPDSVTSIGGSAFYNCPIETAKIHAFAIGCIPKSNLKTVEITSGEYIESNAFSGCSSLKSITISDSITSIGNNAFSNCPIETAKIPAIACSCIRNNNLKTVEITSGESIGNSAFYNCSSLTSIIIPDSVTSIGDYAFENCPIETAKIPTFVIQFIPKSNLKTVEITSGESIGNNAFRNCNSLTSITIPDSVTSIGNYAFYNCSSLKNMIIPDSVTSLPQGLLYGCSSLENITIPFVGGSIKTAGDTYQYPLGYIFGTDSYTGSNAVTQYYYSSSTRSATYTTYYIPLTLKSVTVTRGNILYGAFHNCSSLTSVTIPDSVTSIESYAFNGCSSLTRITIGNNVTSIRYDAFNNCSSLMKVYYDGTASEWNKVYISSSGNDYLTSATRYYYSETMPTEEGNYWHYENGEVVEWSKN